MSSQRGERIAVTGATGLVGSHLTAELLKAGYVGIRLIVRDKKRLEQLYRTLQNEGVGRYEPHLDVVETALTNPLELAEALEGIERVFHCAATVSLSSSDSPEIQSNVDITQHIVNASLKSGVKRLIHVSSIATIGEPVEGERYADESTTMESLTGRSPYAESKFFSENEIVRGAIEGLETIIVNPSVIIGAGDWRGGSTVMMSILSRGLPLYTEGVTGYVDVRDVARAMVLLSRSEMAVGERFILSSENLSYQELINMANLAIHKSPPRIRFRHLWISIAWRISATWAQLTERPALFTREVAIALESKSYFNGAKVERFIDFKYSPIKGAIERVLKQYIEYRDGRE